MFETIREILAAQLDIDESVITKDTDIIDDLGADSLDIAELVTSLEEEYGFVATSDAVHSVRTLADIEEYLRNNIPNINK